MYKLRPKQKFLIELFSLLIRPFLHVTKRNEKVELKKVKNILIVDTIDVLGDMVILLPFLRILKQNAPFAEITICARPLALAVFKEQDVLDKFIPCSFNDSLIYKRKIIKELNNNNYDMILNPGGDFRDILFMYFIKGKRKISHTRTGGEFLLTDPIPADYTNEFSHALEDRLYVLKQIGCTFKEGDKYPRIILNKFYKNYNEEFLLQHDLKDKLLIGIHPGASGIVREWPYYGELMNTIENTEKNLFFLVFAGPNDIENIKNIEKTYKGNNLLVIREKLENYISLVNVCDYFISNDSGAAHVAAAYGKPTIDIFTNNIPERWKPYNFNQSTICISHSLPCKPCYKRNKCKLGNYKCKYDITVEEVFEKYKLLKKFG